MKGHGHGDGITQRGGHGNLLLSSRPRTPRIESVPVSSQHSLGLTHLIRLNELLHHCVTADTTAAAASPTAAASDRVMRLYRLLSTSPWTATAADVNLGVKVLSFGGSGSAHRIQRRLKWIQSNLMLHPSLQTGRLSSLVLTQAQSPSHSHAGALEELHSSVPSPLCTACCVLTLPMRIPTATCPRSPLLSPSSSTYSRRT